MIMCPSSCLILNQEACEFQGYSWIVSGIGNDGGYCDEDVVLENDCVSNCSTGGFTRLMLSLMAHGTAIRG